jgi:glycosyltransferase involved in cell wall biosynthesis
VHIIECHFEFSGYDDQLVKAGTSVYLWNLVRQFRDKGHRVTAVTAAHGLLPRLRRDHEVEELDWTLDEELPVRIDPTLWPDRPEQVGLPIHVHAHRIRVDGIEIILLGGGVLDEFEGSFYPPRELEGKDLAFLKPLVFQAAAARYLQQNAEPGTIVHFHEPFYHYLLPAAVAGRGLHLVSTVQTNMAVNTKVYRPEVSTVLEHLGADPSVADGLADPELDEPLDRAMRGYLPRTLLYRDYPERPGHEYISMLALVSRSVAAMDFLSEGQRDHALTQAETPFEQLFQRLAVRRALNGIADRMVVGGCAIGDEWHGVQRSEERRIRTLEAHGLDPALPTVFHNARYSVEHKGQRELLRGLRLYLDSGRRCNVLAHLLAPWPPEDEDITALREQYPDLVRIDTGPMDGTLIEDWATASDVCVFPSKFEMDTFLMAMGEAMAAGSVPIATAQRGMRHFGHRFELDDPAATGLAVPRSFRVADPALTEAVYQGLVTLLDLYRDEPAAFEALRARAVERSHRFTWSAVADRFLAVFEACVAGRPPAAATPRLEPEEVRSDETTRGRAVSVQGVLPTPAPEELEVTVVELEPRPDGAYADQLPESDGWASADWATLTTYLDGGSVWRGLG